MNWLKETKRLADEQKRKEKEELATREMTRQLSEERRRDFWDSLENQTAPKFIEKWKKLGLDKILRDVKEMMWPYAEVVEPMLVLTVRPEHLEPEFFRFDQFEDEEGRQWCLVHESWPFKTPYGPGRALPMGRLPIIPRRSLRELVEAKCINAYLELDKPYLMGQIFGTEYSYSGGGPYEGTPMTHKHCVGRFHLTLDEESITFGFGQFPDVEKVGEVSLTKGEDANEMVKVLKEKIDRALAERSAKE